MTFSKDYIRNNAIRAEAETFANKYPQFSDKIFAPQYLTFHGQDNDKTWKVWKRSEVCHFALTSDLSYWMAVDSVSASIWGDWWSICDTIIGYLLFSAKTGKTFSSAPDDCINAVSAYGINSEFIRAVLTSFARHISDIPYGSYLFNPSKALSLAGSSGGIGLGSGLALAAVGGALMYGLSKRKKKR